MNCPHIDPDPEIPWIIHVFTMIQNCLIVSEYTLIQNRHELSMYSPHLPWSRTAKNYYCIYPDPGILSCCWKLSPDSRHSMMFPASSPHTIRCPSDSRSQIGLPLPGVRGHTVRVRGHTVRVRGHTVRVRGHTRRLITGSYHDNIHVIVFTLGRREGI